MVVYMDPLGKLTSSLLAPRVGKLRDDFVGVGGCLFVALGFQVWASKILGFTGFFRIQQMFRSSAARNKPACLLLVVS